jgi:two-component system, OmpR family, sensor histidine kinase KdpD
MTEYAAAVAVVAITTALSLALRRYFQITDIAMLFLLAVVVIAYAFRRGPAVLASLLSIAAFDFGFVPPFNTFRVQNTAYFLTFAVMLAVALTMSQLTGRIREEAEDAGERERETAALYAMSRELAGAGTLEQQLARAARHIAAYTHGEVSLFWASGQPDNELDAWLATNGFEAVDVRIAATLAYEQGDSAGWGTPHYGDADVLALPLQSATRTLGIAIIQPGDRAPPDYRSIQALVNQAAVSLERTSLAEGQERSREEVESERLRTALLSSLSHDLRTPLASIEGAASSLLHRPGTLPEEGQREMAEAILEESRRMTRLVTNLLDMVRVETGALSVQKTWQPLEEVLGVALLRLEERLAGRRVQTRLAPGLPLVPIDELLIEQVFINLLDNAIKHTPAGTPVTIVAEVRDNSVLVEVADEGSGIPPGEEELIFGKFHRSNVADHAAPAGGSGLGLTICRGIITAHGGKIWVERDAEKGAVFRFTLPLDGPAPSVRPSEGAEG